MCLCIYAPMQLYNRMLTLHIAGLTITAAVQLPYTKHKIYCYIAMLLLILTQLKRIQRTQLKIAMHLCS